ncbi:hypothetical protein HBA54_13405 [Pelagibius litoralis]|uniref:Uncharacterized protein n=1 Tax=Pelagibius litoralis TaxID=374515 RepID=A0A967EY60_9PROT|nr:hypothetical protein [Pelagibius litoralis]NIA69592.1 hypothetical protein [Pelagibius litoralis]
MFSRTKPGVECLDQVLSTRHRASAAWRRALLPAGALALAMTAAGPALADYTYTHVYKLDAAIIEVASDGENYTTVSDSSPAITGMWVVHLDADIRGRVKSWAAWPAMVTDSGPTKDFPELGKSASYPLGDRPKKVTRKYPLFIPLEAYRDYATDSCNRRASFLRNTLNKTDEYIFARDRSISVKVSTGMTWKMSGGANDNQIGLNFPINDHEIKPVTIVCLKTPVAAPPPPLPPAVLSSNLSAGTFDSVHLQGSCVLQLAGTITTTRSDMPVTFRYVDETGKESDVKTISPVPGVVKAMQHVFTHSYPLDHVVGEKNEGKIRMVGENIDFTSDWADYDVDCSAPTNDLLVALPPKATRLEAFSGAKETVNVQTLTVVGEESTSHPYLCPARMRVEGGLQGRGKGAGTVVLFVDQQQLAAEVYDVDQGETVYFGGERELSWHVGNVQGQEVHLQMVIRNMTGEVVDTIKSSQTFKCEPIIQGTLALTPPKVTIIQASAQAERVSVQNYTCPARVRVRGGIQGQGPFSGTALIAVNNQPVSETSFNVDDGQVRGFEGDQELIWNNQNVSGQTVWYRLAVLNDNKDVVDVSTASKTFKCDTVIGGKGVELPASQPTNDNATAQAGLNFNIVTPKNRVRNGQIRLTGAKPDQAFKLRFLRKSNSGGYKIVNSAQLPKQMTGGTASFNMAALDPGLWRLRVCLVKGGSAISKPKDCKKSDFEVLGKGTNSFPKAIPGAAPQPQTNSVIPNIGG